MRLNRTNISIKIVVNIIRISEYRWNRRRRKERDLLLIRMGLVVKRLRVLLGSLIPGLVRWVMILLIFRCLVFLFVFCFCPFFCSCCFYVVVCLNCFMFFLIFGCCEYLFVFLAMKLLFCFYYFCVFKCFSLLFVKLFLKIRKDTLNFIDESFLEIINQS